MKSAIVVGCGFAGLAAALELARGGVQVDVFEAAATPGGRAQRLTSSDGRFTFDMGPTLFVLLDVLRSTLGEQAFDALRLQRLQPGYRVFWHGGDHLDMYSDLTYWLAELARFQGKAGVPKALEYLAVVHEQMTEARAKILDVDLTPVRLVRMLLQPGKLRGWMAGDLRKFTERYFSHPRMVQALCFQTLYLGVSPLRSPAIYALLPTEEIVGGVWYPPGGTAKIVAALQAECEKRGVRFHFSSPVSRVMVEGGRARGVVADGSVVRADAVAIACDREPALTRLLGTPYRRRLRYGHSAIVYYFGFDGPVDLPHHSIMLSDDPWQSYAQLDAGHISDEPLLYVCNPARSDPGVGVQGAAVSVLVPVPNLAAMPEFDEPALRAKVLATLERHAGPLTTRLQFTAVRGPAQFESELGLAHGAAFGPDHGLDQMGPMRPGIAYRGARNVAFAGSGTRPGSGVPMVLISGRLAARHLLETLA